MSKLTLNQRLALLAVALGALAVLADVDRGRTLTFHERDYATRIERTEDHVTVQDLAAWIVSGRSDYRLIDLRDGDSYAAYHIPSAENVPLATLGDLELLPTEKVVLYSDGGIHASQALLLLWAQGTRNAYTLLGGLDAWKDEILFPMAPAEPTRQERAAFERAAQLARFFGGRPRAAASGEGSPAFLDVAPAEIQAIAPPAPAQSGPPPTKRRKKEGC